MRCQIGIREMERTRDTNLILFAHLSKQTKVEVITHGPFGLNEIDVLIKRLEIDRSILAKQESHNATPTQHETATSAENTDETDS